MRKLLLMTAAICLATIGSVFAVFADDGGVRANPVEYFACDFKDGKGVKDLKKVNAKFKKWARKNDSGYSSWVLMPQFTNASVDYDFGFLGSWPSSEAFGAGQDAWQASGQEVASLYGEVMTCRSHEMASSVPVMMAADAEPGDGVVMFYPCNVNEGKTLGDAHAAVKKQAAAMKALGANASSWLFYPALGADLNAPDFWRVLAFGNYKGLGAAGEVYTNGGGWQKTQEILAPVVSCMSPGVFDAHLVTAGARN